MVRAHVVDVLDVSDLRFPGGTSHSIAEEVEAQARAGYRTGLLHLNGPLVGKVRALNPQIRRQISAGHAELLFDRNPITAKVVVFRHPAVAQHAAHQLPEIHADHVVVVANAGPFDIDGHQHYDPAVVHRVLRDRLGVEPVWAPIGPLVRTAVTDLVPGTVLPDDWVNIIDVDAWRVVRDEWRADRPVVGRHSRSSPQKWPADASTLRAVYPVDGSWTVRVLGGGEPAWALLGELPESWEVQRFGAQSPRDFLAGLDFFVYYHDPRWVEAFGRTILEALASGAVAVLPPHFRALFGEAARYAEPAEVRAMVDGLRADRDEYEAQVRRAEKVTRELFGHEAHVARLTALIGPPTAAPATTSAPTSMTDDHPNAVAVPTPTAPNRPRALFVSSNGAGMGHLTRLLAYARRAHGDVEPHFLSMSQAVPVVGDLGYPYEYLPSSKATGLSPRRWRGLFIERMLATLELVRPSVVVFDGTWPYDGVLDLRAEHPEPAWIWSRRGMWRAGKNREQLAKAAWFDAVIEPGDLAAPLDVGVTVKAQSHRVGPVTLLDRDDLDDRATARRALGLPAEGPVALVSLGAGNINDTRDATGAVVAALRDLGVDACVTKAPITASGEVAQDVHVVSEFPLSRRYAAFDVAVSAAGYNSFHELLRFGVPALFVPNTATALDNQEARTRFAAQQGFGHELHEVTVEASTPLLADLLEHGAERMRAVAAIDPGNGADAAAELIAETVRTGTKAVS